MVLAVRLNLLPLALLLAPVALPAPVHAQNYAANIAAQVAKVHKETAQKARFQPNWNSLAAYRTPVWFRDAKFGIFLHWGVYSVPAFGNEWYSRNMYIPKNPAYAHHLATYGPVTTHGYKDFIPMFKAEHFDPNAWLDLFVQAGARYVVPVAEHCDGFAMYASRMTPYNAALMGPHRDVVGELEKATRAHGLHFGVSSHTAEHWWWYGVGRAIPSDVRDMTPQTALLYGPAAPMALPTSDSETTDPTLEPDPSHLERWLPPDKPFLDGWLARSTELVDMYHPDFVYFDWWIGQPAFQPALQQFAAYFYNRSAGTGHQPILTYKEESMPANAATLDIERGKLDTLRLLPWQTDTSISIHSWGYVENDQYRTAASLIQQLLDTVSKNGDLLLNVGPKSDGTIPDQAKAVLLQIGAWLKINGEAIYGSRPFAVFGEGPTKAASNSTVKNHDIQTYTPEDVRYTVPGLGASGTGTAAPPRTVYAAAMAWPSTGRLTLHTLYTGNPYLPSPVCAVTLLGDSTPISFHQTRDGLHLALPSTPPPPLPSNSSYVFRLETVCH